MPNIGKFIIGVGIILIILGIVLWQFSDKLNWFGNLPGDIRIEKENFRFYAPLASMLIISVILTALIWLIRKLF